MLEYSLYVNTGNIKNMGACVNGTLTLPIFTYIYPCLPYYINLLHYLIGNILLYKPVLLYYTCYYIVYTPVLGYLHNIVTVYYTIFNSFLVN